MTTLPALASRAFHAKTLRVWTINRVEAIVDLDFGVTIRKSFTIDGLALGDALSEDVRARAVHCLVVLIGGKRLIVQPDPRSRDRWGSMREIAARVYLAEKVNGSPIGYTENLPEASGPVLELAPYVSWLAQQQFDIDLVRETMNGRN